MHNIENFNTAISKHKLPLIVASIVTNLLILCCCCITLIALVPDSAKTTTENSSASQEAPANLKTNQPRELIKMQKNGDYQFNIDEIDDIESRDASYTVTRVVDGDTIVVEEESNPEVEISVRLIGIDTPETKNPRKEVECFGAEASANATAKLLDRQVYLVTDTTQADQDQFGRLLRYVVVEDGYFYNLNAVKDGYANEYTYEQPYEHQQLFIEAQETARSNARGLHGQACQCTAEQGAEVDRQCSGCKRATIDVKQWDCSTTEEVITDDSCTSSCPVPTIAPAPETEPEPQNQPKPVPPTPAFTCDCNKTCSQVSNCSEAYFQLNQCGCSKRDEDNDGIPCETQCG